MTAKIMSYITHAKKVSFTTDIWTQRGMSSSYLGVSAHHNTTKAMLAVRKMEGSHTGENIRLVFERVLEE